jgi:hypothetical protein
VDQATAALLGAFIGATAGITGGVALEMYKRRRDRQGTASALAGEIASILFMTEKRRYLALFENALPILDAGQNVLIPDVAPGREFRDPIADRHLDRLGLLPWNLPERIVRFFTLVVGVRTDVQRMAAGEFAGKPFDMAAVIREDLAVWREATLLGRQIVTELQKLSCPPWRAWTGRLSLAVAKPR